MKYAIAKIFMEQILLERELENKRVKLMFNDDFNIPDMYIMFSKEK
jgi:hypothetical protein